MNKTITLCISALFLYGCGGSPSDTPPPDNIETDGFEILRTTAKSQLAGSVAPAVSIAIYKDGEVVFAEAFGKKIKNGSSDVDVNTLFQLGSTTKMFTALGALRLVDNDSLGLDSTLLEELPEIQLDDEQRAGWQQINVHHLMTHQGGFEDFVDWENNSDILQDFALSTYPGEFDQMNPAGIFWNYSNPNWSYLGAIIERETSLTFQQAMEQTVFEPLGMTRTTMEESSVIDDGNYALGAGMIINDGSSEEGYATQLSEIHKGLFSTPAGSYTWSTPSEVLKMADFLMHGNTDVLGDELRTAMVSPQVDIKAVVPLDYGYGIFISEGFGSRTNWYPIKRWDHGGNSLAYTSQFWVLPEENIAVAILSSGEDTDFDNTMMAALRSVMTLPTTEQAPVKPVATDLFEDHTGRYEGFFGILDVYIDNEELHISLPGYDAEGIGYNSQLEALGGSVFKVTVDGENSEVTFIPEVEGGISTYIKNRGWVAVRNDDAPDFVLRTITRGAKLPALVPAEFERKSLQ